MKTNRKISFVEFYEKVSPFEIQPWQKPIIAKLEEMAKQGKPICLMVRPRWLGDS